MLTNKCCQDSRSLNINEEDPLVDSYKKSEKKSFQGFT